MNQSHKPNNSTQTEPVKPKSASPSKHEHWKPIISAWRDSSLSQRVLQKTGFKPTPVHLLARKNIG